MKAMRKTIVMLMLLATMSRADEPCAAEIAAHDQAKRAMDAADAALRKQWSDRGKSEAMRLGTEEQRTRYAIKHCQDAHQRDADRARRTQEEDARRAAEDQRRQDRDKAATDVAAQQAADAAAEEKEDDKIRDNPKALGMAMSTALCVWRQKRGDALKEIDAEKRYARTTGGGMVDKQKLYGLQLAVRRADGKLAEINKDLKGLKVKMQPCSAEVIKQLVACVDDDGSNPDCHDPTVTRLLSFVPSDDDE